ncbi:L-histidine N(alpha)-methyltransferase [Negadavirga shengliensis]|uniref:L-histidine N(Alpha)-methyltransferase n=1 Tax=Negadavirga shengliensis TaxID=1389218 RepID=A0ABV9T457_9BACT
MKTDYIYQSAFAKDVAKGLTAHPKHIPSRYFYDEYGDLLFQQIMKIPEYYLTRSEFSILETDREKILKPIVDLGQKFNLIELGVGDGFKSKLLLSYLYQQHIPFTYYPNDISSNVLDLLSETLKKEFPDLSFRLIAENYFEALKKNAWRNDQPSLMIFLGSNVGNYTENETKSLLDSISASLESGDQLLLGFDLKKDPAVILRAYNDEGGVTKAFNLNLLKRINRELGADFDLDAFRHWPVYDPVTGTCKSHLVSLKEQRVFVEQLGMEVSFEMAEPIFTEISQKYSVSDVSELVEKAGFEVIEVFMDDKRYFADMLCRKIV